MFIFENLYHQLHSYLRTDIEASGRDTYWG